jgi:hypothetical protein
VRASISANLSLLLVCPRLVFFIFGLSVFLTESHSPVRARPLRQASPAFVVEVTPPARRSLASSPGTFVLPDGGEFPAPPEVPSRGPTDGTSLLVAIAWYSTITAAERRRAALIAELDALERERRVGWHNYLDILGYQIIDKAGPLNPGDPIRVPSTREATGPGPSKGKGKGKERAVDPVTDGTGAGASGSGAAEDDDADEVSKELGDGGAEDSGSGRMDTS